MNEGVSMNILTLLKIGLLTLITNVGLAQTLHSVRFVHIGIEEKPIGTVVISVEKIIPPNDRELDNVFGKSIKTNLKTFETVVHFIEKSGRLGQQENNESDYHIIVNNKKDLYLNYKCGSLFFQELRSVLRKANCDKAVIEALKNKPF